MAKVEVFQPTGTKSWKVVTNGRGLLGSTGKQKFFKTKSKAVKKAKKIAKNDKPSELVVYPAKTTAKIQRYNY